MILELSDLITQYTYSYTKFSTFNDTGLLGAIYGIVTFYIFCYLAARGKFDKPHDIAFNSFFPAVVVVLFLAIIGVPDVFKGFALFIVYYGTIRFTSTMSQEEFFRLVIYITIALGISAFLTRELAFLYLLTVYAVYYVQGNMRIKEREQKKKEAEKKAKEAPKGETKPLPLKDGKTPQKTENKNDTKTPLKEEKKSEQRPTPKEVKK